MFCYCIPLDAASGDLGSGSLMLGEGISGSDELIFKARSGGIQSSDGGTYECTVEDASFGSANISISINVIGKCLNCGLVDYL